MSKTPHLMLFVAGRSPISTAARENIEQLCHDHLGSEYTLSVIDVLESTSKAAQLRVILTPTLIIEANSMSRRFVGRLEDEQSILAALRALTEERIADELG